LSSGAVNSPQLLLLSGIGHGDHLKELGIPIIQHIPAVGQNMEDHLDLYIQYKCTKPITLHNATWLVATASCTIVLYIINVSIIRRKYPHKMIQIGAEWFLNKTGMGASAHLESGGFIRR